MAEQLSTRHRAGLVALLVVNAVVLLGQLWPEGAPPFAGAVNVGFLVVVLGYLVARLRGSV